MSTGTLNHSSLQAERGITAPKGFRAAGVRAGIKRTRQDLALIVSDVPAVAAGVFTTNTVQAAPVTVTRQQLGQNGRIRAIVVNSGNANACTGRQGYEDAVAMVDATARALRLDRSEVLVASTGVIGHFLPMDRVLVGIQHAAQSLDTEANLDAAMAIMTTDTFPKQTQCTLDVEGIPVTIGGMAKGSGMIAPNMATMLGFITTDAAIEQQTLQDLLRETVKVTFNHVVVDGDTSTNDMVLVLANGQSGAPMLKTGTDSYYRFATAFQQELTKLAKMIARDGEGATKFLEVTVLGASSDDDATKAARAICVSPLVKTAIYGEDPNWGRMLAALGNAKIAFDPNLVEISLNGLPILKKDFVVVNTNNGIGKVLSQMDITIAINLSKGQGTATFWTCDLTEQYITINAHYRT
ncbi:MAG TPA: bifunctional glutamate N-acetyltransferase/amino-acid acetyltransferase ArgJ [Bacteroidota bacterium]